MVIHTTRILLSSVQGYRHQWCYSSSTSKQKISFLLQKQHILTTTTRLVSLWSIHFSCTCIDSHWPAEAAQLYSTRCNISMMSFNLRLISPQTETWRKIRAAAEDNDAFLKEREENAEPHFLPHRAVGVWDVYLGYFRHISQYGRGRVSYDVLEGRKTKAAILKSF